MVGALHHLEDIGDEVVGDTLVEEIRHRVDEDPPGSLPLKVVLEAVGPEPETEALLVGVAPNPFQRSAKVFA